MYHRNIYADTVLIACELVSWPILANPFIDEVGRDGGCDKSVCNMADLVRVMSSQPTKSAHNGANLH